MRRFGSAVVLTAVLVFAVTAWASGSPGGKRADKGHAGHGKTIRFYAPTVQFKLIDLGDAGVSLGDESVFSDDLLTAPNGKPLGFDGGTCTVVRVKDAATQTGTFWGSRFKVLQSPRGSGMTSLALRGGNFSRCPQRTSSLARTRTCV